MTTKNQEKATEQEKSDPRVQLEDSKTSQYNKEELLAIFDEMIFSGEYVEDINLRGGKLKISFRSRSVEDTSSITRDIDVKEFKLITTLQEYRAIQNLAYSLVKYAGNDWSSLSVADRVSKINKLPAPLVGVLSAELNKFDMKIMAACEEGEANF